MAESTLTGVMTLDEFIRRYDQEGPFELIDGEPVPKMPTVLGHGAVADNLSWAMNQHVRPNQLGKVYTESPFVLVYDSNWVSGSRIPDVMFVSAARLEAYIANDPDWKRKPLVMAPDLAVEIISPTDSYADMERKVERYLADGVRLVWVIDPDNRLVKAHAAGSSQVSKLSAAAGDALAGGDILPGFSLPLADLFGA